MRTIKTQNEKMFTRSGAFMTLEVRLTNILNLNLDRASDAAFCIGVIH